MSRRLPSTTAALVGAAALAVLTGLAGSAAGASLPRTQLPRLGGAMVKTNAHALTPRFGGTVQSGNWSGYAVTPGSGVTAVTSSFDVPAAGLVLPGLASTWAGIGGFNTPDLIQAGVAESSFPTLPLLGPQYYAWYELLPNSPVALTGCTGISSCAVVPGDVMNVKITETAVGSNLWTIFVQDVGKWTDTLTNVHYTSSNSSAEWILEAPTLLVAPVIVAGVGTAHFLGDSGSLVGDTYTLHGGTAQTIASGTPTTMDLSLLGIGVLNEATPSTLAGNGESFNVCTYTNSCAPPG